MTEKQFDEWYDKIMEQNSHMTWVSNCYWYLEDYSCVLVPRNKKWFESAIPPNGKNLALPMSQRLKENLKSPSDQPAS